MFCVPVVGFRQGWRTTDRNSVQLPDIGRHGLSFRWSTDAGTGSIVGLGILLTAYGMDVQRPVRTGMTKAKPRIKTIPARKRLPNWNCLAPSPAPQSRGTRELCCTMQFSRKASARKAGNTIRGHRGTGPSHQTRRSLSS